MNQQQQLREAKILFASGQLGKSIESFNRAEEQGSEVIDTCSTIDCRVQIGNGQTACVSLAVVCSAQFQEILSLENNGGFASVRQIGFLIADMQDGPFRLEIEWIHAF